tara:strand:- start:245 stop:796 length:552 start_codon:yes stop_codon:yes gene_type:complete
MKKNIIKPKFYTLQEESVNQPSTGYIFLKHYRPILSEKNKDKKYLSGITKLYYQTEVKKSNREYINIAEIKEKMDIDSFNQYLIINYNISPSGLKIKKLINSKNLIVYLVLLNIETKLSLYYENFIEIINRERLSETENYWGLLSTNFTTSRKNFLNRCLYPTDNSIKLEMRFKKVYKALIEI